LVDIYNAADIIISRAGAGTLAEIAFFEKKCIIIPLKTKTNNHQVFNAQAVAQEKPTYFTCADASSFEKIMSSKLDKIL
jgi:UDP-N-acetylglucosamine--N-acetylmuramyl-(pentapeptide) pyrophosphoryl-undecaprenol N-acetylglucosamine transferase